MVSKTAHDYIYNSNDPYVYKGTDVLINKFGLKDFDELWNVERELSGAAAAELEAEPIEGSFDLEHLSCVLSE